MALDTRGPLEMLVAALQQVDGIQAVVRGIPKARAEEVYASVTLAGRGDGADAKAYGGLVRRETRYVVWLWLAVGTQPDVVEDRLAGLLDQVETALYTARASNLGGTAQSVRLDFTLADNPDYVIAGGTERRVYPLGVAVTQSLNTSV